MNWNYRTFLRLFLLVGGVVFLFLGLRDGERANLIVGGVAVVLGVGGLAYEIREATGG